MEVAQAPKERCHSHPKGLDIQNQLGIQKGSRRCKTAGEIKGTDCVPNELESRKELPRKTDHETPRV